MRVVNKLSPAELYGMRIEIIVVNALIKPKSNYRGEVENGGGVGTGFGVLWWGEVKLVNYER